ncbi:MAG: GNAT family N-acetyltransferase [Candidatus Heimdallarchaeota archaeon]|nr:GNAT family N-acetyltransferase [Candidatus Heimdallarchaeota archaeon]
MKIQIYDHHDLPEEYTNTLAELMRLRHQEFSDMPTHQFNYYLDPLHQVLDATIVIKYILVITDTVIGYSMLEYRQSTYHEYSATIKVFVRPDRRGKGIGRLLLSSIPSFPSYIQQIEGHCIHSSPSSLLIQRLFSVKPHHLRTQYYLLIHQARDIESELAVLEVNLDSLDLELVVCKEKDIGEFAMDYASLLEIIWNEEAETQEAFPVERLLDRVEYFNSQGIHFFTVVLRNKIDGKFVGLYETVLYDTNKYVADEAMIGVIQGDQSILLKTMKLKALEYLLKTEVTHWESAVHENHILYKINQSLGFIKGKSFDQFSIPVEQFVLK